MPSLARIAQITLNLGFGIFLIGVLFRLMHYPYASEISFFSALLVCFGIGLQFYISINKTWIDYLGIFAVLIILSSLVTPYFYPSVAGFLSRFSGPSILFLIATQFMNKKPEEESPDSQIENYTFGQDEFSNSNKTDFQTVDENRTLSKILFYVFAPIGILGLLFKTQHYPGASILSIVGFLGTAVSVMIRTFTKK